MYLVPHLVSVYCKEAGVLQYTNVKTLLKSACLLFWTKSYVIFQGGWISTLVGEGGHQSLMNCPQYYNILKKDVQSNSFYVSLHLLSSKQNNFSHLTRVSFIRCFLRIVNCIYKVFISLSIFYICMAHPYTANLLGLPGTE